MPVLEEDIARSLEEMRARLALLDAGEAARVPDGVTVAIVTAGEKDQNMFVMVFNKRTVGGSAPGGRVPDGGQVSESVSNAGDLKGDTAHSSWGNKMTSSDRHSIPRSRIAGGASGGRFLFAGRTVASQLFRYKSSTGDEFPIPNSGFTIEYTSQVFVDDQEQPPGKTAIADDANAYALLTITKSPAAVTVDGESSAAGAGSVCSGSFRISPPAPGTLIWQISET